jgi:hypothetical protein
MREVRPRRPAWRAQRVASLAAVRPEAPTPHAAQPVRLRGALMLVRCFRRFRSDYGAVPEILTRDIEIPALPPKGTLLEFQEGHRAAILWLVVKVPDGTVEVGTESEPRERRAAADADGWKPLQAT